MSDQYKVKSTSKVTSSFDDIIIASTQTTRKILRAEAVENPKNPEAGINISIVHQRKSPKTEWVDEASEPFSKMKAGEAMKMSLDCAETLELHKQLQSLYAIHGEMGAPRGQQNLVVASKDRTITTTPERAAAIKKLLSSGHSKEVWDQLVAADPDLATQLCLAKIQGDRKKALAIFEKQLNQNTSEAQWESFFKSNTWIFGYGLSYRFIKTIQNQASYGGAKVDGRGNQKGDFLSATQAATKFTVLVEIKRADTLILGSKPYRNGSWAASEELVGGLAQLQSNCHEWEVEGARLQRNQEALSQEKIITVKPKGILIIGNLKQLKDGDQIRSFELLRRNTTNPEIITFDELYEKARFIIEHGEVVK